jgi:omega-hydroxy-beta-dihydromenaquinone-9 sulfotransferase
VRDPYVVYPSTVNLWKRLYQDQGLQRPNLKNLPELVFQSFVRMYEAFERDRPSIPAGHFCEVRYEELIENPLRQMQRVYEELRLGQFDKARPALEAYFAEKADYKTNRYTLPPETRAEIGRRWQAYIQKYGYADETGQA